MRRTLPGSQRFTKVEAVDEKAYGANHAYEISAVVDPEGLDEGQNTFTTIRFQKGPIKETGVNGIHNEDLIHVVLDRLYGFQDTLHACRENAIVITKLEEALHWLNHRTQARQARGVEGTSEA